MRIYSILFFLLFFCLIQLAVKSQTTDTSNKNHISVNPEILEITSEINKDSIYTTILQLCSFGTRSVYAGNRREVAIWTIRKFESFGFTNTSIDSFKIINKYPPFDSIWQYNVSAEIPGISPEPEVYLVTSHPDSYTFTTDPRLLAPGANDDGSGMAGMLEIARVLKKKIFILLQQSGFQPYPVRKSTWRGQPTMLTGLSRKKKISG
jgi:hypothetical protein